MPIDTVAERLIRLLDVGFLAASEFSDRSRQKMRYLFDAGFLEEEACGGGFRVCLRDRVGVERWIRSVYPSGLHGSGQDLPPRAGGVANFRNSKRGGGIGASLVFLRGFFEIILRRGDLVMDVVSLTAAHEVVGCCVRDSDPWSFSGRVLIVENGEVFLHAEDMLPLANMAIFASGCLSDRVIRWLASMSGVSVIHAGDYDPIGLWDYLRLKQAMPGRVELYVPSDLEKRIVKFGNRKILEDSEDRMIAVRRCADEAVLSVLSIIDRHGLGLEQESLLLDVSDTDPLPLMQEPHQGMSSGEQGPVATHAELEPKV